MRELVRGYADAVIEDGRAAATLPRLAADLAGVLRVVDGSNPLRTVLSDPGIPVHARRGVLHDLVAGQVDPNSLRLLLFTVDAGRAPEVTEDLAWLATRLAAARDDLRPVGRTLGRSAATERVDGYATAVLEQVSGDAGRSDLEDELFRFERVIDASEPLRDALASRDLSVEARAGIVGDLLAGKASPAALRLTRYLTHVGRPRDYTDLLNAVVARVAAESRRRVAEVRAAVALSADQERRLAEALSRIIGQRVDVRVAVDPTVLGGFVATIGDTVIDGSARHRLDVLKERLVLSEATSAN